jgi:hypothetical protein
MAQDHASVIVGLSGNGDLPQLHTYLKQNVPSITGRPHLALQAELLLTLNPSLHSLGMLYVL